MRKREEKAAGVYQGKEGSAGTLPGMGSTARAAEGNGVPKDDDILGGEEGKTFTTHSRCVAPRAAAAASAAVLCSVHAGHRAACFRRKARLPGCWR